MKLQGSNILGQEQIDLLTTRGLNFVWFPKQLETIYRFQYQNGAAYEFRYRAPIILILYIFLSFGIYQVLPSEQVLSWFSYYSWVGVIVLIAWILSFITLYTTNFIGPLSYQAFSFLKLRALS